MDLNSYLIQEKITEPQCADALGVSQQHINRLRNRKCGASFGIAKKIVAWSSGAITLEEIPSEGVKKEVAAA